MDKFALDLACRLAECRDADERWGTFRTSLGALGASAVIAGKVQRTSGVMHWVQSDLPKPVLNAYLREGYYQYDLIARHSAFEGTDLIWQPENGWTPERDRNAVDFSGFVNDSGYRSIVNTSTTADVGSDRYAITYCSEHAPGGVLTPAGRDRILLACKIFLPWLRFRRNPSSKSVTQVSRPALSPRERDALCYLAAGLQNGQISDAMCVSDAMVSKHLFSARTKLGAKTAAQAVALAIRSGQISL